LRRTVISRNEEIAKVTQGILKKIPLKVRTSSPESSSGLGEQRDRGVVDLVILDECSFPSRQAALKTGEALKEEGRFNVLFLRSKLFTESEQRLLLQAADASFDVNAIRENRSLLIRLLYRQPRGGKDCPYDTVVLWRLMEARVGAILLGTLFRLLFETTEAIAVKTEYEAEQVVAELNGQFLRIARNTEFSSVLARKLLAELPPLFWVYVVESLVSRGRCEAEGLGIFKQAYDLGRLTISFEAGSVLSQLMMPDMDFSGEDLDSSAIHICERSAFPHLYELTDIDASADVVGSSFVRAIGNVSGFVAERESLTTQKLSAEDILGHEWKLNGWLGVLARAAVLASYYALALSLGRTIRGFCARIS
jgi:hypothetical protein